MIDGKKIIALIPARGGSKGIKDKNIFEIEGKPLIAYTIDEAKKSRYIDEIIVSTDSEKIKKVSLDYGASVPFIRPGDLSTDKAATIDVVIHALNYLKDKNMKYDYLVLLQPTSPLRKVMDIDEAIKTFANNGERGLASVSKVSDSPILIRNLDENSGKMKRLIDIKSSIRRQDMPVFYRINGAIYINLINEISENTSLNDNECYYVMSREHSVDIDEYVDIEIAKYYLGKEKEN